MYITTPIYYINDLPHIGHSYTSIAADVIARFWRLAGEDVFFSTGTDEHGKKILTSSEKKNIPLKEFIDQNAKHFQDLAQNLGCSHDVFIRTSEDRHKVAVHHFWKKIEKYIYKANYSGWYSIRDEAFYTEDELIDGKAPTGAEVEFTEEESYFFELSKFQDKLLNYYEENPGFIYPEFIKEEVINFIQGGKTKKDGNLKDISISRVGLEWGIDVPGDDKHKIYVWVDALINYLTVLDYPAANLKFWPADLHIIGKDIVRFHAVYWPALLMAADLPLPKKIIAHGWWTNNGEKISKSVGNVISPYDLIDNLTLDGMRYFMLSHSNFSYDRDYSDESAKVIYNSDLANNLGNLCHRVLTFIRSNCDNKLPMAGFKTQQEMFSSFSGVEKIFSSLYKDGKKSIYQSSVDLIKQAKFHDILSKIIFISQQTNVLLNEMKPWSLKDDPVLRGKYLFIISEIMRCLAILLLPFMPDSMNKLLDFLAVDKDQRQFKHLDFAYKVTEGASISKDLEVLFNRLQ